MKKALSLRARLILMVILFVLLQVISLAFALKHAKVFSLLDSEAFRLVNNNTDKIQLKLNSDLVDIVESLSVSSVNVVNDIKGLSLDYNDNGNSEYTAYDKKSIAISDELFELLRENRITGAFVVMDDIEGERGPTVYIRNQSPVNTSDKNENFFLEVGPISVSKEYLIPCAVKWSIDSLRAKDVSDLDFYKKPVELVRKEPYREIMYYGFWSKPFDILSDGDDVITYTLPLLGKDSLPIGVIGIELEERFFATNYISDISSMYDGSFYVIGKKGENRVENDFIISNDPLGPVHLKDGCSLEANRGQFGVYNTELTNLGKMFVFTKPIKMYSDNSPFISYSWDIFGFVKQSSIHETSKGVRNALIASLTSTTFISLLVILLLIFASTKKITDLSKYLSEISPGEEIVFPKTYMTEVDGLTNEIEKMNTNIIQSSKTLSNILDLTLLPMGGFEVKDDSDKVKITEFIYNLLGLSNKVELTKDEWEEYFGKLVENPVDVNIYHYEKNNGEKVWLKINERAIDGGRVGVIADITKEQEEKAQLIRQLDLDSMTGLLNRDAFNRYVHLQIKEIPDSIGVMIFSGLDNLKYVNDTYGHNYGDKFIKKAGDFFSQFKEYNGLVARISGDEFAVYLHGFKEKREARNIIMDSISKSESYYIDVDNGRKHHIRFTSGLAWYPEHSDSSSDLLKFSDYAMFEAKQNNKGSILEFEPASYRSNVYLLENREAINKLIDEGQIRFAFQPIIDIHTGSLFGYEFLMRSKIDSFKNPFEVISVAKSQSKLRPLERLVFKKAFQTISENLDKLEDVYLFINSIPSALISLEELEVYSDNYPVDFSKLVIELTESESDLKGDSLITLQKMRAAGLGLAIDDFGKGYSGELRILQIKPDIIKIDMDLIQGISDHEDKQKLVSNLVSFCKPRGIKVLGEGVETEADLKKLKELGLDLAQGYFIGKPELEFKEMPEDIKKLLEG
ncbi:MAG: EAL domain-containing protein [Tissierellia bacterium]|nr:EAL domain-containing protein [Tissierellia bacterium]